LTDPRQQLGLEGERLAERYLRSQGLKTVARRFRTPVGEIDLVMQAGESIVFVEVKTLRSRSLADPEDKIRTPKQRKLALAANWFLRKKGWEDRPCRFDVVAVVRPLLGPPEIEHLPDAFTPEYPH